MPHLAAIIEAVSAEEQQTVEDAETEELRQLASTQNRVFRTARSLLLVALQTALKNVADQMELENK